MIQPDGPSCVKCGRLLDIRRGRFIHQDRDAFDRERYGYHIPQIIVPSVVFNPRRWAEIYDMKCRLGGNRKFLQEILGIPVEQGEREIEIDQIQRASEMPVTIYAGTSLTTDSALERKYQASSMASWITQCGACNHWNVPLPEYNVLDMIQPKGPCCVKCGSLLNIRAGFFVPENQLLHDHGRRGYHIPQIIIPAVFQNPMRWADIYEKKVKMGGNRKFLQEILGIATEEGEREITLRNLKDICTLSDMKVLQERALSGQHYEWIVSGCDWGGSDYIPAEHIKISTTVHVMQGVRPDGTIEIFHMRRYSGMNYDDIIGDILYHHFKFKANAIASDFGVGALYNSKIRERVPAEKHLIFNYVGPDSALISEPAKGHIFNQWSLNKTESISMTYQAVRDKRIRCTRVCSAFHLDESRSSPTDCAMPFTSADFHDRVDTDLWVLEQVLTLPSDPEPTVERKPDGGIHIHLMDTYAMPQMQEAVVDYRRGLLPVVFVVAQKVYAELFRVMLGQNGRDAGKNTYDVEVALQPLIASNALSSWQPFPDAATFTNWWAGPYDFAVLRKARNHVVHRRYTFANGRLDVAEDDGTQLLSWGEKDILRFAEEVTTLGKTV